MQGLWCIFFADDECFELKGKMLPGSTYFNNRNWLIMYVVDLSVASLIQYPFDSFVQMKLECVWLRDC